MIEKLFCVIGYPLEHSLSPYIFNEIFKKLNLPYSYIKVSFPYEKLPNFIASLEIFPIVGVSVTIPFKEKIIPFLDEIDENVKQIKSLNTLYIKDGKIYGYNTDWIGIVEALKGITDINSALILGSGGTARSSVYALGKLGVKEIYVSSRNPKTLENLKREFGIRAIKWEQREEIKTDMLVNTTPVGMKNYDESSPMRKETLKNFKYVFDVVYNPIKTKLISFAEEMGCKTVYGIKMFVAQAIEQLKIWTNKSFDKEELEKILKDYLT